MSERKKRRKKEEEEEKKKGEGEGLPDSAALQAAH